VFGWFHPASNPVPLGEVVPPRIAKFHLAVPLVSKEEISEVIQDSSLGSTDDHARRRDYCTYLLQRAQFQPVQAGRDIVAVKPGRKSDCVVIGAHFDKAGKESQGILDNMIGCILVSKVAQTIRSRDVKYTYVFVLFDDEETGRILPYRTGAYSPSTDGRPAFMLEVDYVGDKRSGLIAKHLSPAYRYLQAGMKLTSYPMPDPPTIHTIRDNLESVDFSRVYLAYQVVMWWVENLEAGEGLSPPPNVSWRKPTGSVEPRR